MVNLELDDNIKDYSIVYINICMISPDRGYPAKRQHTLQIFLLKRILWFIFSQISLL